MKWLYGEPRLDEVLADPIILALMRRDRVDPAELRVLLGQAASRAGEATGAEAGGGRGSMNVWDLGNKLHTAPCTASHLYCC